MVLLSQGVRFNSFSFLKVFVFLLFVGVPQLSATNSAWTPSTLSYPEPETFVINPDFILDWTSVTGLNERLQLVQQKEFPLINRVDCTHGVQVRK
jgi:hypothetical protein